MPIKKLKAGALYYAVFIAFVIIVISGFFILSGYYTRQNIDYFIKRDQLRTNIQSGYTLALDNLEKISSSSKSFDLFGDGNETVEISRQSWGLYSLLYLRSSWKNLEENSIALTGLNLFKTEGTALYLVDNNNSLSISGNTFIRGLCYLPKQQVKRAYIEGKSYSGSELIYGEQKISKASLPAFNQSLIQKNRGLLQGKFTTSDSIINFSDIPRKERINNSFYNKRLVISVNENKQYFNKDCEGQVMIHSTGELIIDSDTELSGVLIYARKIVFEPYVKGTVQAFASDTIVVGRNCELGFPSGLVVYPEKDKPVLLDIHENTSIFGDILCYQNESDENKRSQLKISKQVEINGQVYSNATVVHQGKIYGSLYADKFLLKTLSSVYENHLLDATIDFEGMNKHYAGSGLMNNTVKGRVIKYMN